MQVEIEEVQRIQCRMEAILSYETGLTLEAIEGIMSTHENVYITPGEAVGFGIADIVV